jgi:hypothetical protein
MPKNTVIFSDATGQAGGISFGDARMQISAVANLRTKRACVGMTNNLNDSDEQRVKRRGFESGDRYRLSPHQPGLRYLIQSFA